MSAAPSGPPPPPPPIGELLERLGSFEPVRTRRPRRAFATMLALAVALVALTSALRPLRLDLPLLPWWWVTLVGAAWLTLFVVALRRAVVPARGQVLPAEHLFMRTTGLLLLIALALALCTWREPRARTAALPFLARTLPCLRLQLLLGGSVSSVVLWRSRRMLTLLSWRIGALVGAAGGALGGFALHLSCGYATVAHVALGHVGGIVADALLGAALSLVLIRAQRRIRRERQRHPAPT